MLREKSPIMKKNATQTQVPAHASQGFFAEMRVDPLLGRLAAWMEFGILVQVIAGVAQLLVVSTIPSAPSLRSGLLIVTGLSLSVTVHGPLAAAIFLATGVFSSAKRMVPMEASPCPPKEARFPSPLQEHLHGLWCAVMRVSATPSVQRRS